MYYRVFQKIRIHIKLVQRVEVISLTYFLIGEEVNGDTKNNQTFRNGLNNTGWPTTNLYISIYIW